MFNAARRVRVAVANPTAAKSIESLPLRRALSSQISESDDDDLLDITPFGEYSLVLPDDPSRVGVSHILPAIVPQHIQRPPYAVSYDPSEGATPSFVRPSDCNNKLKRMRRASAVASLALRNAARIIKPGVTTKEINDVVHKTLINNGVYPSPLLYRGFPMSCCTSVNNVIAHGIPDNRPLEDGDIVNVDVTAYKDGCHGDTSQTFLVGNVDEQGRDLVDATNQTLWAAIRLCGPGVPIREIGRTIQALASRRGFCVSPDFYGHGIGSQFHCAPWISHIENNHPGTMAIGQFFTIEPALIQGTNPSSWMLPDGWTVLTETGARSAQAEHTIAITPDGTEVLTDKIEICGS